MTKRILVTGSAGFVASHFVEHVLENTDWEIIGLDSFRHRGDPLRVQSDMDPSRYKVFFQDLSATDESCGLPLRLIDKIGPVDFIVNYASDSHVDRSIEHPIKFAWNNVGLALSMLQYSTVAKPRAFVQISTDEVYGAAPVGVEFKEWDRLLPSNPYAASKASQESFCIAYWRTYGVPIILTNTMNLFGARQDPEKFIPMTIGRVHRGEEVMIHGSTEYIGSRFYIHARNQADAVLWLLQNKEPVRYEDRADEAVLPTRYNIVGETELNNLEVAQAVAKHVGKPLKYRLQDFHSARPGHDRRYALDGSLLASAGWKQPHTFEESLEKTVRWTLEHPEWLR